jgi:Tol biopolymer transport system component/predicted Ser/Thr protein kinase
VVLNPGTRFGPYEVVGLLGTGGMGQVYRARDPRLDRDVAIKVSAAEFSQRFEREARAIAQLSHPHICQLFDVGPNYPVMEYIEGTPLGGPLPAAQAVTYACQILEALDAAHRKHITHRDLKPANILVTAHGIKLLDFGLAKLAGGRGEPSHEAPLGLSAAQTAHGLTVEGQIVGTLQYMSPEQLHGKVADARSDLFSFGCVLYEMLSGRRAFDGGSPASVIAAVLEREPVPLGVPPQLERVIETCLAKDPDRRFQNAADLKRALTWAMGTPPAGTAASHSKPWWWAAAAALMVLVAAGAWTLAGLREPADSGAVVRLAINSPADASFVLSSNTGGFAISPDGRHVAFVATAKGQRGLWVQALDEDRARLLSGTEGASFPFWSADSRSIAYADFVGRELFRIDPSNERPVSIGKLGESMRGGAWGSDGTIILGTLGSGLFRIPASGGVAAPLTTLNTSQGETAHRWPQMLPGNRLLYWIESTETGRTGAYVGALDNPTERTQLVETETNAWYAGSGAGSGRLLWLRGDALMSQEFDAVSLTLSGQPRSVASPVSAANSGLMYAMTSTTGLLVYSASSANGQFTWVDRTGARRGTVGEVGDYGSFRLSPDGRRVAAPVNRAGGQNLLLIDLERSVADGFDVNQRSVYPVWSPDGRTVAYASGTPFNLFRRALAGGVPERLTQSPNAQFGTDWSRDGRFILYYENDARTGIDLWVLPVTSAGRATDIQPRPYLRTRFVESLARFSPEPEPKWVAYQSDRSGQMEIYVDRFPEPREPIRISTNGGRNVEWNSNGRELFYLSPEFTLMAVSLAFEGDSLRPSPPRELFPLPVVDTGNMPYDVSGDGQRFLVRAIPPSASTEPLRVIVNWPGLLK